jgi:hypothetical protein
MSDETAKMARLMRVTDAVIAELDRQGVAEVLANLGFDPILRWPRRHQGDGRRCDPIPRQSPRPLVLAGHGFPER